MSDDLTKVLVAVARVEEKLDAVHVTMDKHLDMDNAIHHDHEKRVRSLEAAKWRAQGMAVFLAGLVSAGVAYLFKHGGN